MLDDKLIDYISQIKSPFEEDDVTQEELELRGYFRYQQDCILKSIGTSECITQINLFYQNLVNDLSYSEFNQFLDLATSSIVKQYRMSYLSELLIEDNDYDKKKKLFLFLEHNGWFKYFTKCLSTIDYSIIRDESKIKIFITADYDSFVDKLNSYKSVNDLIKKYFTYCNRDEGIETLFLILKKDLIGFVIEQNSKKTLKEKEIQNG